MDTKKITLTHEQLQRMSNDDLTNLLMSAEKIEATAVVQRADGSIKYDDPTKAGSYGEEFLPRENRNGS